MAEDKTEEFQKQTRELLRAQQESYIAAVKKWRESLTPGHEHLQPPPWPQAAPMQMMPSAVEVAEGYYAFAAKLLSDQSRFMEALSHAMAAPAKKP